ncbi:hypothetical protein JKP88DRAFT_352424 [Tribonema minus]|uniref:Uncharacterized protein n=1 Tax=Tribonema minus TaxID=303371 RepID=A0A835ZCD3_9STRA|nr:hypothetical protein JKP88DRAFT_352424 [Tribonema minus]
MWEGRSRNVRLVFAYSFLAGMCRSLWSATVMSTYIYLLTGSEARVGYVTGIQGTAQALAAPLGALVSDKRGRVHALRVGGAAGLLSVAATAAAVAYAESRDAGGSGDSGSGSGGGPFAVLCCAMAAWGVTWAVADPGVEALFADCVPCGQRSGVYTAKYVLTLLSSAAGPLVSIILFVLLGDVWTTRDCAAVILVGVCLAAVPNVVLFAFRAPPPPPLLSITSGVDRAADDDLSKPLLPAHAAEDVAHDAARDCEGGSNAGGAEGGGDAPPARRSTPGSKSAAFAGGANKGAAPLRCGGGGGGGIAVPAAVALSDVMSGLASGMSIRFFPIFFMSDVGLPPVAVSAIYAVSPLLTSAAATAAQRLLAPRLGRAATTVVGISLLVLICGMRRGSGGSSAQSSAQVAALILVYLVRTALMNCSKPLTRSIIMDTPPYRDSLRAVTRRPYVVLTCACPTAAAAAAQVPPAQRARWSALESVSTAGWSGSAIVGGLLVERCGMLANFAATAALQATALAPLLYVACHEPREVGAGGAAATASAAAGAAAAAAAAAHESSGGEGAALAAGCEVEIGSAAPCAIRPAGAWLLIHGANAWGAAAAPPGSTKALKPLLRPRQQVVPIRGEERDILMSRIEKELVKPYMKDVATKREARPRLLLGMNEVIRALERSAAPAGAPAAAAAAAEQCRVRVVLLSVRDVKAPHLVEHVARMARTKCVPLLVLPNASKPLSELFATKTLAAMAFRPAPEPTPNSGGRDEGSSAALAGAPAPSDADMASALMLTRLGGALAAAGALAGGLLLRRASTLATATPPSSAFSVAYITSPTAAHARELAGKLVRERLAACVNIVPAVSSVYVWKGELQEDEEVLMMCKTRTALVKELSEFVVKNHPYEVCEVITTPILDGNPPYLKWLGESTRQPPPQS